MNYKKLQLKKDTRYIGQNKKNEQICNELKKTKQDKKDWLTWTSLNIGVNVGDLGG